MQARSLSAWITSGCLGIALAACGSPPAIAVPTPTAKAAITTAQSSAPVATSAQQTTSQVASSTATSAATQATTSTALASTSTAQDTNSAPPATTVAATSQVATTDQITSSEASISHVVPPTPTTPASMPVGLTTVDALRVASMFLTAMKQDPSGASAQQFLSQTLLDQIKQGRPILTILDANSVPQSFTVDTPILRAGGRACTVNVTYHFSGAADSQQLMTLVPESGSWHVDDISSGGP